jgi:hypothetical protein
MALKASQLATVKGYLEDKKTIREWMADNDMVETPKALAAIVNQLRKKYTPAVMQPLYSALHATKKLGQVARIVQTIANSMGVTPARCDEAIADLQTGVAILEAKKAELQG